MDAVGHMTLMPPRSRQCIQKCGLGRSVGHAPQKLQKNTTNFVAYGIGDRFRRQGPFLEVVPLPFEDIVFVPEHRYKDFILSFIYIICV